MVSICRASGCAKPASQKSLCWAHYARLRRHGSLEATRVASCLGCGVQIDRTARTGPMPKYCASECRPREAGRPTHATCSGCMATFAQPGTGRLLKYCRPSCRYIKTDRDRSRACASCDATIDLTARMEDGRLRYQANTATCDPCRAAARPHRYGMTARQIADRDGTDCSLCGLGVDFALVGSRDKWAPSVDHIIPWSRGGTNAPENLQLAHRVCNAQKGVRMPA